MIFVAAFIIGSSHAAIAASAVGRGIDLGTAASYSVLGGSMVTNVGSSTLTGDLGVSPGSSITGFDVQPNGVGGALHNADSFAMKARHDVTTAYGVAAGFTPTKTRVGDLSGLSLAPGVYSDGALSLSGQLTLAGDAASVWVFQSASTLITGSGSKIIMTGGASICNVFWQVGSSAVLGAGTDFVGTILAYQQIDLGTGSTVHGRLFAHVGAVNLDYGTIVLPTTCARSYVELPSGTSGSADSPIALTAPRLGVPYSQSVAVPEMLTATYTASTGELPAGLLLDTTTGLISGIPTGTKASTFSITASNSTVPQAITHYSIPAAPPRGANPAQPPPAPAGTPMPVIQTSRPILASTGFDASFPLGSSLALIFGGLLLFAAQYRMLPRKHSAARHSLYSTGIHKLSHGVAASNHRRKAVGRWPRRVA